MDFDNWLGPLAIFGILIFQAIQAWRKGQQRRKGEGSEQGGHTGRPAGEPPAKASSAKHQQARARAKAPPLPVSSFQYEKRNLSKAPPRGQHLVADRKALRDAFLVTVIIGPPRSLKPYEGI